MKQIEKTLFDSLKLDFKKVILGNLILEALFLLLGVIIFMNPLNFVNLAGVMIGIFFILSGAFSIVEYFMKRITPIFTYKIFFGVLAILLGIFIMFNPLKVRYILTLAFGIYLVITSIFKIFETFKLKKYGYDGWAILLATSVILLVFGVFVVINPLIASMEMIEVTAIFIILSSILEICNYIMVYSRAKEIEKLFKEVK